MTDSSISGSGALSVLEAQRQSRAALGFRVHLAAFWIVMTGLVLLNVADHRVWWVEWPLIGWGLGVLGHGILVLRRRNHRVSEAEKALLARQHAAH